MKLQSAIIGSGIAGMAAAVRLASEGHPVTVFEAEAKPGGKISSITQQEFRFDTGPSLMTLPGLFTELFKINDDRSSFLPEIKKLDIVCRYFFPDKTVIDAFAEPASFAGEIEEKTGVPSKKILKFLSRSKWLYEQTADFFLFSNIHDYKNLKGGCGRKALKALPFLGALKSMDKANRKYFNDSRIVQLFDRFATYNGSNPFSAPSTLNIIPHLEHNLGAYLPEKGMVAIIDSLYKLAVSLGVKFEFNAKVESLIFQDSTAYGVKVNGDRLLYDAIISNVDIYKFYNEVLSGHTLPLPLKKACLSSSAIIFFWGIQGVHNALSVHNILFSGNYRNEFLSIENGGLSDDVTVYIYISSKVNPDDAPENCENWFVMVNAPPDNSQNWFPIRNRLRKNILSKIKSMLGIDIENKIITEHIEDPVTIEKRTGSWKGALYGPSSNSPWSAFMRHPNYFRSKLKNLYFTGGSVHPGGGIPLCLSSAKIVANQILQTKP